jgi:heavy metal efflux system protein
VRWQERYRDDIAAIRRIAVTSPDGSQIPLAQLATITEEDSPSVIYREDGQRYSPVKFSVRDRDLGSTIAEAQARLQSSVPLPPESHLDWAGQINELKEAMGRLSIIIPLTLLLIGFLVYSAVGNWLDTLIVLLTIPLACSGGIAALLVARESFSVSAAMGFISIFGIGIQGAILVVTYAQRQWADGRSLVEGAMAAARQRFRPVLMTTLVATLGLLPAAISNGIGAQSQKPLAIVVIGGSLTLAFIMQLLMPPTLVLAHRVFARAGKPKLVEEERAVVA